MKTATKTTQIWHKFCTMELSVGSIVAAERLDRNAESGTWSVVTAAKNAEWRGDDRDVYSYIDSWYQSRPATTDEAAIGIRYSAAWTARDAALESLGNPSVASIDDAGIHTREMRMLDSYDDRFDGSSKTIPLNSEQRAAFDEFTAAEAAYKSACK